LLCLFQFCYIHANLTYSNNAIATPAASQFFPFRYKNSPKKPLFCNMPVRRKTVIPVHRMDEENPIGLEIHALDASQAHVDAGAYGVHRDDHYVFILLIKGTCYVKIDTQLHHAVAPALLSILPGQVHQYISSSDDAAVWFLAADSLLIGEPFQPLLNEAAHIGPVTLTPGQFASLEGMCNVLSSQFAAADTVPYYKPVIHSLVTAFTGIVAGVFKEYMGRDKQAQRGAAITSTFRQLLAAHYKTMKSPADYAAKLNLSLSYLNETVKAHTGFPVGYWIQQETMTEARRLLYYSQLSVKEVAYQLGYDDPTYFSRLFKKVVDLTPGGYRKRHRE
jgi:AraC-like DNA-binding protein